MSNTAETQVAQSETLEQIARRITHEFYDVSTIDPDLVRSLQNTILSALRNERERCAKVAETYLSDYRNNLSPSSVAAVIREGR